LRNFTIAVFGSYSGRNKGDLAILLSVIENLVKENQNLKIHVFSKQPENLLKTFPGHFLPYVIVHKSITAYLGLKTVGILKSTDLLIFGGGGLFFDKKPLNIFYNHVTNLFLLTLINKVVLKKPVYIFSVGASHIKSKVLLWMTKFILDNAQYVTVRDERTFQIFSALTHKKITLHYDPAFLLINDKSKRVGFPNLLKSDHPNERLLFVVNESIIKHHLRTKGTFGLVDLINALQEEYHVVLTSNNQACQPVNQLYDQCIQLRLTLFDPNDLTPQELIAFYRHFNFAICTPMHAAIFAYNAGVKLVTIEYDEKIPELNKIIGNKNSVSMDSLESLPDILVHYQEIDRSRQADIDRIVRENFRKLNQAIIASKEQQ
jgi:polysaccharide pyruvyl transferase WcaK-like protein